MKTMMTVTNNLIGAAQFLFNETQQKAVLIGRVGGEKIIVVRIKRCKTRYSRQLETFRDYYNWYANPLTVRAPAQ